MYEVANAGTILKDMPTPKKRRLKFWPELFGLGPWKPIDPPGPTPIVDGVIVTPNGGLVADRPFVMEVNVSGEGFYMLEVDHSMQQTIPEFTVYADENDPYAGRKDDYDAWDTTVEYSNGKWTLSFGTRVTDLFEDAGEVRFYLVIMDANRNVIWGSMDPTTPENTFTYEFETPAQ